ncbi:hypothetical protein BC834DRAFT_855326 [Gloeopeniophorella convolvens]|nr:hypothetical protein BC834DRAFT_855326 [Gloeopeniophorella convolvens]
MPLQVRAAALPSTLHAGLPARRHPTCGTEPVMTLDANTHKSSPRSRVRGHITSNSGGSSPTLAPSPCSTSVPNDTRVITLPCSMKHGIYISGKGGGLIPMTSFRAVMDASWCATALSCHTLPCKTSGSCASSVGITLSLSGTRRPKGMSATPPRPYCDHEHAARRACPLTSSSHEFLYPGTRGACCWP